MGDDWATLPGLPAEIAELAGEGSFESEQDRKIREWRLSQFLSLGFALADTLVLVSSRVDLNDARKLIALGCPPALAAEILL